MPRKTHCLQVSFLLCRLSMKPYVLLVNPWIYDFAAYDYWMKPLGLMYMASYLRKNGLDVRLVDCLDGYAPQAASMALRSRRPPRRKPGGHGKFLRQRIAAPPPLGMIARPYHRYGIDPEVFYAMVRSSGKPRAIMVTSMMTYWYPGVIAAVRILKDIFPESPVILGGIYATLCSEHARAHTGADYVLTGAGEGHMDLILETILGIPASYRPDTDNLDALPYPAWDLLPHVDQLPVLTSRGCPCRCPYCATRILNRKFRRRRPWLVVDEIAHWRKTLGVKNFSFYDDALLVHPEEMAIPLLKDIIIRNLDAGFHCPNGLHLREITPDIATLLFRAGFRTLRFGLETTDRDRQRALGGKVENVHFEQATAYLREAGYKSDDIAVYLLCGLPGQSAGEIRESIRYVQSHNARPILAEYSPLPGTELWDAACQSSPYPLAEEPLFHNNSLLPCAHPTLTTPEYHELKRRSRGL